MTRGPYEPYLKEFVECTCTVLEEGHAYTINEARKMCKMGYRTIHDYMTFNLIDVNDALAHECKRAIKSSMVSRNFPGFTVHEKKDKNLQDSDQCTVEPQEKRKLELPSDLRTIFRRGTLLRAGASFV
jgi:uncharacterized protein (UPF0179 family)